MLLLLADQQVDVGHFGSGPVTGVRKMRPAAKRSRFSLAGIEGVFFKLNFV